MQIAERHAVAASGGPEAVARAWGMRPMAGTIVVPAFPFVRCA